MDKKVGKKEILLLVIIFVAAVIGYFVFQKMQSTPGGQVKVTVDGSVYGTYDLHTTGEKAQKIEIKNAEGTVTNTLVIENGKADMISADCPDKLCVNQHAISSNGLGTVTGGDVYTGRAESHPVSERLKRRAGPTVPAK